MYHYKTIEQEKQLIKDYKNGTLRPTSKEQKIINPEVAYEVTEEEIAKSVPVDWISKHSSMYGSLSRLSFINPVKNLNWDFLFFKNTDIFRPAAIAFQKSKKAVAGKSIQPSYTSYIPGTKAYKEFWREEFNRITFGYEPVVDGKPCGVRISGEYYFYLNYSIMEKIVIGADGKETNITDFPEFLVMDYYYFKELEARENPSLYGLDPEYKRSIVLAKSRRKGFSFKAAAGCCWIICFNKHARVGVASEANSTDENDAVKCVKKCNPTLDHLSKYTPFGKKDPGDPKTNGGWKHEVPRINKSQASITLGLYNTKTKEKAGRQSTVFTMVLSKDDAASGEGLQRLYIEEAGKVQNLNKVWSFSRETLKAGSLFRGIAVIFGTGGEMTTSTGRDGSSKPFSELFYSPRAEELAEYDNIYEYKDESQNKCGYFVSDMWSHFGAYVNIAGTKYNALDENGNPFFWVAELALNKKRKEAEPPNGTQKNYNTFLTQRCKTPGEAFLIATSNYFNTADIIGRRNSVKASKGGYDKFRRKGELVEDVSGNIEFKMDLDNKLEPITSMDYDFSNREGCLLVYEFPQKVHGEIPEDAYFITVDPIGKNTDGGKSLNAVIVMKTSLYEQYIGPERIVATYFGRKKIRPLDYLHRLLIKLSKFYNARISFENDQDGGILNYFVTNNALHRLMEFPTMVTKKHIPGSKTLLREFGHSMSSDRHKAVGEMYLNEWLDYRYPDKKGVGDDGNVVNILGKRNLDYLEDEFITDQLINYNRAGNFDAVDALMGAVIQLKEKFSINTFTYADVEYVDSINAEIMKFYGELYEDDEALRVARSLKNKNK